ncbi:MAG TPA: LysM peptidoglycan-binding domain-containing protein [Actinomycetes bacterium]|nr:LysM peptidoglycan-binding domain-containing protein [Actinomycetes bacterium]
MSTMTVSPTAFGGSRPVTVRLTRRGRLLLTLVLLVVAVVAAVLLTGGGTAAAGADPAGGAPASVVTVRPGETIWAIAERVAPGRDPRDTVQAILDLNGLQTSQVRVGTALRLP